MTISILSIRDNIEFMVRNQDKFIKRTGEKEYFRLLNLLIDADKNQKPVIIEPTEHFSLGVMPSLK